MFLPKRPKKTPMLMSWFARKRTTDKHTRQVQTSDGSPILIDSKLVVARWWVVIERGVDSQL